MTPSLKAVAMVLGKKYILFIINIVRKSELVKSSLIYKSPGVNITAMVCDHEIFCVCALHAQYLLEYFVFRKGILLTK